MLHKKAHQLPCRRRRGLLPRIRAPRRLVPGARRWRRHTAWSAAASAGYPSARPRRERRSPAPYRSVRAAAAPDPEREDDWWPPEPAAARCDPPEHRKHI